MGWGGGRGGLHEQEEQEGDVEVEVNLFQLEGAQLMREGEEQEEGVLSSRRNWADKMGRGEECVGGENEQEEEGTLSSREGLS